MPRSVEHVLDDIFLQVEKTKTGNVLIDEYGRRVSNLDNFGDKMADPFGSEDTGADESDDEEDINRNARRRAKLDWLDDEGNEVEDDEEQKQRNRDWDDELDSDDRKKNSSVLADTNDYYSCLDCNGNGHHDGHQCHTCEGSGVVREVRHSRHAASMMHTAPGGGPHAPYRIQEDDGGYKVVNDQGETKGTHDTKEDALDQQAAMYVNVPGAKEQAEQDEKSKSSRRRKLPDYTANENSGPGSGPTFSAPDTMRGSWKCNDCDAQDLGVHDLNGHAEAHRQTTHRAGFELFL